LGVFLISLTCYSIYVTRRKEWAGMAVYAQSGRAYARGNPREQPPQWPRGWPEVLPQDFAWDRQPSRAQWRPEDFHHWPELDDADDVDGLPDLLPPLPQPREAAARSRGARLLRNALFCLLIAAIIGGAAVFALSDNPRKSFFG
jgi:hypothetical protein